MDGMKSNRKFKQEDEAVSAVIGVILMVAITVAIAATVYVYVSGMIGTSPESTPNMQLVRDNTDKELTVASADPGNLKWSDFNVTASKDITNLTLNYGGNTPRYLYDGDTIVGRLSDLGTTTYVTAGDYFNLTGTGTITLRHTPTNTLIGTYTFS
jgi:flagellin-like protein